MKSLASRQARGLAAAMLAFCITSTYAVYTRSSIVTVMTPEDLIFLRLGISGLLFAPYLIWKAPTIPRELWLLGGALSFLHGWGMVACVIFGLGFAPASHATALGPGALPLWIALLSALIYGARISWQRKTGLAAIATGILFILALSGAAITTGRALVGDLLFLCASGLAAGYLLIIQHRKIPPALGVAFTSVYSAIIVIPWHWFWAKSALMSAPLSDLVLQAVLQGGLMGCVWFLAVNYATLTLGSQTTSLFSALVPIAGILLSAGLGSDPYSSIELIAALMIGTGVVLIAASTGRAPVGWRRWRAPNLPVNPEL